MNKHVLVTYASRSGTTRGVAEAIGKSLAEAGATVEICPMKEVVDLSPYDSVVAGSAIQGQKWLPEAMQFLRMFRAELSQRPLATFMVCITLSMTNAEQYREGLKGWMAPVRDLVHPVSEGYFAGTMESARLPISPNGLAMRLVVLSGLWKEGDHRDWAAINAWARDLRPLLLAENL